MDHPKEPYETEGCCYVLVKTSKIHPITYDRFDFVWYPEDGLSLLDAVNYIPYVKSIVTENPWLIATYSKENVRVWDKDRGWVMPSRQTYGASVNHIMMTILGIRNTIPAQAMDGGKSIQKFKEDLESTYV